jgi:uncharacterized membrane protein
VVNTRRRRRRIRLTRAMLIYLGVLLFGAGVMLGLALITRDPAAMKTAIATILLAVAELVRQTVVDRRTRRR